MLQSNIVLCWPAVLISFHRKTTVTTEVFVIFYSTCRKTLRQSAHCVIHKHSSTHIIRLIHEKRHCETNQEPINQGNSTHYSCNATISCSFALLQFLFIFCKSVLRMNYISVKRNAQSGVVFVFCLHFYCIISCRV